MDTFLQDVRFAIRSLAKNPGLTIIAALCIALGIGANVFVYAPINAILIRPLPYPEPQQLVHLNSWRTDEPRRTFTNWSYLDFRDLANERAVFQGLGATRGGFWNIGGIDEPERLQGSRVTSNLFSVLGLRPALGRFFTEDDVVRGNTVVLSHGVWQRRFASDSGAIGRSISVNGQPHEIIGIMAEGVRYPEIDDIWLPLVPSADMLSQRDARDLQVIGRLQPNVTPEAASQRIAAVMSALAAKFPETNRNWSGWTHELKEDIAGEVRSVFLTMLGAVFFVLLIACSNVANLLLARGSGRQRELAVRVSMGANRLRLIRQMLTESLILASLGGVLGVLLGVWGVEYFATRMMPTTVPFWMRFDVDGTVLTITLCATGLAGIIFGIAPALQLSRPDLSVTLKEAGGRGGSAHASVGRLRSGLVVTQLAMSLVLLVGATLMLRSFFNSRTAPLGFDPRNLVTAGFAFAGDRYDPDSARTQAMSDIQAKLRAIPGARGAALAGWAPVGGCCTSESYYPTGTNYQRADAPTALYNGVSPGYFKTMDIALVSGREFAESDDLDAPRVAVVSASFARRVWPNEDALGKTLRFSPTDSNIVTVVGVARDIVARKVTDRDLAEQIYVPLVQSAFSRATILLRTASDAAAMIPTVRSTIRGFDADLPLRNVRTMDEVITDRMFEGRVYGSMFSVFGAAALFLASIGLYGVMSYAATQRTQEVGVRMALGARPNDVVRLLVGSGMRLLGFGLAIGLPLAFMLAKVLRGSLYGVSAADPITFVAIPVSLALVSFLASYLPARRATRVQPVVALRAES